MYFKISLLLWSLCLDDSCFSFSLQWTKSSETTWRWLRPEVRRRPAPWHGTDSTGDVAPRLRLGFVTNGNGNICLEFVCFVFFFFFLFFLWLTISFEPDINSQQVLQQTHDTQQRNVALLLWFFFSGWCFGYSQRLDGGNKPVTISHNFQLLNSHLFAPYKEGGGCVTRNSFTFV